MEEQEFGQRDSKREREKRNKFRTKKVKSAIASQVTEAAQLNTKTEKLKNPEEMVSERVEIADVLRRTIKEDKRKQDLPTLEKYLKWLMEKVDQKSEGELILDWKKECDSMSDKTGGPGGQNRNKVDSAWNMKHKVLLVRVKKGDGRNQIQNRADAEAKMAELINKHISIWLERLTNESGDWKEIVLKTLVETYQDLVKHKKLQDGEKRDVLENCCRKGLGIQTEGS